MIDSTINLTLDQVNLSRGNYDERMVNQRERIEKTQAKKDDHGKGIALIYGVPNACKFSFSGKKLVNTLTIPWIKVAMAPELAARKFQEFRDFLKVRGKFSDYDYF